MWCGPHLLPPSMLLPTTPCIPLSLSLVHQPLPLSLSLPSLHLPSSWSLTIPSPLSPSSSSHHHHPHYHIHYLLIFCSIHSFVTNSELKTTCSSILFYETSILCVFLRVGVCGCPPNIADTKHQHQNPCIEGICW